jgi:hypothetical protein
MAVHAEGFLDDNQSGFGLARGTREVGVEFVTVGCLKSYMFAHRFSC